MARSGTYAISNWIMSQKWKSTMHFHDLTSYDEYFKKSNKGFHFYRWERDNLYKFRNQYIENKLDSDKKQVVYLLRDPYNHFASTIKLRNSFKGKKRVKYLTKKSLSTVVSGWKEFARQALGVEKFLPDSCIFINYNKWFVSKGYRKDICLSLGAVFTDGGLQEVKSFPNKKQKKVSSFDNRKFDGKAQKMKTLERYYEYKGNPKYVRMFDDEVIQYATELFMPCPLECRDVCG